MKGKARKILGLILVLSVCIMPAVVALPVNAPTPQASFKMVEFRCPQNMCGPVIWVFFSGYLKDSHGSPIQNQEVKFWARFAQQSHGYYLESVKTDKDGWFGDEFLIQSVESIDFRATYTMSNGHIVYGNLITVPRTY